MFFPNIAPVKGSAKCFSKYIIRQGICQGFSQAYHPSRALSTVKVQGLMPLADKSQECGTESSMPHKRRMECYKRPQRGCRGAITQIPTAKHISIQAGKNRQAIRSDLQLDDVPIGELGPICNASFIDALGLWVGGRPKIASPVD